VITPDAFLPVAERFGLMHQIDRWVVREAIRFVAAEHQADRNVQVAINLSGSSLTDVSVLACIEDELRRTGVDPRALIFEATETVAIGNIAEACRFAQRLADIGCAFAQTQLISRSSKRSCRWPSVLGSKRLLNSSVTQRRWICCGSTA
jgi:EAL domain-containing protein (putative c-di-GMP-specific phosphodiesterase class I)